MNNRNWIFGGCILLQSLIYGVGNVITKVAYESITPFWSMSVRFGIAALIFAVFSGKHIFSQLKRAKLSQWLPPALCMACSYISCGVALSLTSATTVGFLISLPVVFTPFIAMAVLRQRYRLINLPVQAAILAGLYLLCSNGGAFTFGWGEVLAIFCAVTGAGAFVFGEKSLKDLDEITVSAVQTWLTFALSLPFSIFLEGRFDIMAVTPSAWIVVLYLSVLCTVVAFRLQNVALTKISSQTVAIILCSEPIFTAAISRVVLGEVLTSTGLAGAAIILLCIIIGNILGSAPQTAEETFKPEELWENDELAS